VNDLLRVIEDKGPEEDQATIEPNIEEGRIVGPEHRSETDSYHTCQGHPEGTSPLQELFTRCVVGNKT
jgi:hypothetical protein